MAQDGPGKADEDKVMIVLVVALVIVKVVLQIWCKRNCAFPSCLLNSGKPIYVYAETYKNIAFLARMSQIPI